MAWTYTEITSSGSRHLMKPGEASTNVNVYLLESSTSATASDASNYWRITLGRCPKTFRIGVGSEWLTWVLASLEITPVVDAVSKWIVKETFTSRDGCTCLAKVSRSAGVRIVDQFRRATVPTSTTVGAFPPTTAEAIAGTKVDMRGTPFKYQVHTQNIVVETMYEAAALKSERQKVVSKLAACSSCRVTTPAELHITVTTTMPSMATPRRILRSFLHRPVLEPGLL